MEIRVTVIQFPFWSGWHLTELLVNRSVVFTVRDATNFESNNKLYLDVRSQQSSRTLFFDRQGFSWLTFYSVNLFIIYLFIYFLVWRWLCVCTGLFLEAPTGDHSRVYSIYTDIWRPRGRVLQTHFWRSQRLLGGDCTQNASSWNLISY